MQFIDEQRIRELLRMEDLIPALEQALIDFSAGRALQPLRSVIPVEEHGGFFFQMPALVPAAMGVKLVTLYPGNAGTVVPTHLATILLLNPATGEPLAVMDGTYITEMRTAAVSALATRLLASPDASVLAILGSGVQAHVHAKVLPLVRDFKEVRVWSRTPAHARRLAREIGGRAMAAEEAVRGADVVVTATNATQAVLQGKWLKLGAHVNAIGAPRPDWRELDDDVMKNVLFVDSRAGALKESGDVIRSGARVYAELGEALAGNLDLHAEETTVFKSLGMAIEDITAAKLVYDAARGWFSKTHPAWGS